MNSETSAKETAVFSNKTDEEILEYFLFNVAEMDEVWGLKSGSQWMQRELGGQQTLPIWPLRRDAQLAAVGTWQDLKPSPETSEFFIYELLDKLAGQEVAIEIMPTALGSGCLISAQRLFSLLDDMRHSGEFTMGD